MNKKIKISLTLIIVLYLIGSYMTYIGLAKGNDIASNLSRPRGASSWITSGELMNGCTYTPIIMGLSLIILSIIFSTVLFIKWFTDKY